MVPSLITVFVTCFFTDVDISVFVRFNKIRALTTDIKDIADALRNSQFLSLTEDGTKVFRTTPIKEKDNIDDCTIYVVSIMLLFDLESYFRCCDTHIPHFLSLYEFSKKIICSGI
jgi:hypothetical protein